jgi:hypothetical protein
MEPVKNSINADLSFAPRLACFWCHEDGASGVIIVGERSLTDAITSHSSIKKERPCSIRAGNGRGVRLSCALAAVAASANTDAIASLDMTGFSSCAGSPSERNSAPRWLQTVAVTRLPATEFPPPTHPAITTRAGVPASFGVCRKKTGCRPWVISGSQGPKMLLPLRT